METTRSRWIPRKNWDEEKCEFLSRKWKLSPILVKLLLNRNIDEDQLDSYLNPSFDKLHDPFLMHDMEKAVNRILLSINRREKILIYGDYDVDGITATSLLLKFMRDIKVPSYYYIPHRENEGYGLNQDAIKKAHRKGIKLIITCDCGVSSLKEVKFARSLGMEVVVTDHHQVENPIPPDFTVLNPHKPACSYPFKELAGVGVAFKLCQAIAKKINFPEEKLKSYLDLVALGTLADLVLLKDENRVLVKLGLERLPSSTTPLGLRALISTAGLSGRKIGEREAGYIIAPRLNACGRLSVARTAVKLMLTETSKEAFFLARKLDRENSRRQSMEKKMCEEAEKNLPEKIKSVLVVANKNWHPGVVGLVASYIKDKYYRPTVVFSINEESARGSARSIPGFSIFEALNQCKHLLTSFGGHKMAAGVVLPTKNIKKLEVELNLIADKKLTPSDFIPSKFFDFELDPDLLTEELVENLKVLSPFGPGNPAPLFLCKNLKIISHQTINRGIKLMLTGTKEKKKFEALLFNPAFFNGSQYEKDKIFPGNKIDALYFPTLNLWQGKRSIQLEIKDLSIPE